MLLIDGVHQAIDVEVEPEIEEVLMDRRVQAILVEELAVARFIPWSYGSRREDAGQLHFTLDRAVLVEVPEDAVVVVADRREGRDHQSPGTSHLCHAGTHVQVPPEDAVVLLV